MSDQRGSGGRGRGRGRGRGYRGGSDGGGGGDGRPVRGGSMGTGQQASRGGSPASGGERGAYQGGRGGGDRSGYQREGGRGASDRGDYQGRRGTGEYRSERGVGGAGMPLRGGPPQGQGGIYLAGRDVPTPDPAITNAEDALIAVTRDKVFDNFPGRRGYGTKGTKIILRTNYFVLRTAYEAGSPQTERPLFTYRLNFGNVVGKTSTKEKQDLSKRMKRALTEKLLQHDAFASKSVATDCSEWIITTEKLDKDLELRVTPDSANSSGNTQGPPPQFVLQARARNTHPVKVTYYNTFNLRHMIDYLRTPSAGAEYTGRTDIIQLLNIIMCKGPSATDNISAVGKNQFFPNQLHPAANVHELGGGLQALRGYFASVRPAVNRLLVNLNVISGAFYKPLPLPQLLQLTTGSNEQKETFLRTLKVEVRYVKDGQQQPFMTKIKTIAGFSKPDKNVKVKRFGNANEVKFEYQDRTVDPPQLREATVRQFFLRQHGITLRYPELLVLNTGTRADPQYLPAELCVVLPGQPYKRLLGADQTASMITFAARPPNLNAVSIGGDGTSPGTGKQVFRIESTDAQSSSIQPFGFTVSDQMLTVPGRMLASPQVAYGANKTVRPFNGSWNCADQRFMKPGRFFAWSVLVINRDGPRGNALNPRPHPNSDMLDPNALVEEMARCLKKYGIDMGTFKAKQEIEILQSQPQNRKAIDDKVRATLRQGAQAGIEILLVILPEVDRWLYGRIKFYGDVEYGVHTVCAVGSKLQKPGGQGMFMGNLALKFNIKGGGINHTVQNTLTKPLDKDTMLVGIDVTHPSPGSTEGAPSVACVVASVDEHLQQWPGSVRPQSSRQEMVEELKEMAVERLKLWLKRRGKLPTKIVIYRDGVSEGQYATVLEKELPAFEMAFTQLYGEKPKWPKVAIIIVGKRHNTRFYPTDKSHADYNEQKQKGSWNPRPGTIVDRHIGGKLLREFWLQAHQGLQGTARPAHYVVIKDDIKFEADDMEQITYNMCYLFNRATKAVSICPPAYYADLLCERARYYLFDALQENHGSDSSVFNSEAEWKGNVHPKLAESTWYI